MKKTLLEELKRIHSITYGEKVLNEDIIDKILSGVSNFLEPEKKVDVPNKADFVSDNVDDFYKTLDSAKNTGGLKQQPLGSMVYQKSVESMQIGLMLLGYDLPVHGVDGLYGPETGAAVEKFKKDNNVIDDAATLNEGTGSDMLKMPIPFVKVNSPYGAKRKYEIHPGVDLYAESGTEVRSPADGVVVTANFTAGACGGCIAIKHGSRFQTRYCHIKDIRVSVGQQVSQGDVIGLSGGYSKDKGAGNSIGAHLHFELKVDGGLADPMDYVNKEGFDFGKMGVNISHGSLTFASPQMFEVLIQKLQEKGVKPQELQGYIDAVVTGGSPIFTDLDLRTPEGFKKYEQICDKVIKSKNPSSEITGYMMANAAKKTFKRYTKYIPPELALGQLIAEGGLSTDLTAIPIKTKNPYNVGTTSPKDQKFFPTFEQGVNAYYDLIARNYLGNGKTANDLVQNFVDKDKNGYAEDLSNYARLLNSVIVGVNKVAKTIV
jgi:murein DD-endopeptidase MepM/ murein hydrolase activator NlpD